MVTCSMNVLDWHNGMYCFPNKFDLLLGMLSQDQCVSKHFGNPLLALLRLVPVTEVWNESWR